MVPPAYFFFTQGETLQSSFSLKITRSRYSTARGKAKYKKKLKAKLTLIIRSIFIGMMNFESGVQSLVFLKKEERSFPLKCFGLSLGHYLVPLPSGRGRLRKDRW